MFEVYQKLPPDPDWERSLARRVQELGGSLDFREESTHPASQRVCLSFEFPNEESATRAAQRLREAGEYVEGPQPYGD